MEKGKKRFLQAGVVAAIFAVALISGFFSAPFAAAQEEKSKQETAQEEKAQGEYELETMTVTAQKQEENVQEVPVSITVFNEQDIEDMKIESVREIADFVPNLMIFDHGTPSHATPSMRGIHAEHHTYTVATGLYVDGVPILMGSGFEEGMLDIERIEVLRGPQGTLYGKNTEAGVINIITRQPDNEFRGRISAQGGEDNKGQFSLNLSGPIQKDRLFLGIAGQYYKKEGFIENTITGDTVDDREHWFGRSHLKWTPNDSLDISLIVSHLKHDDGTFCMNITEMGATMFGLPAPEDRKVTLNLDEGYNKSSSDSQSLKITYDISDSLTLTSVTAKRVHNDNCLADYDYSSATLTHAYKDFKHSKISQELRLDSSAERLKWLVGLYYDKDHSDLDSEIISDFPSMARVGGQDIYGDSYAAFAHLTYLLTEQFSLTTGLRYEQQKQEFEDNIYNTKLDDSWSELTPMIALEYRFTPAMMGYVSASKGYRSGGFNAFATDQYNSYDAEKLWSYEIGAKSAFLDNRLILNGSVYYMDITDMQVTENVSPIETYMTNAAEATARGIELEMTARVFDGLSLMAGFGYSDVEFDSFKDVLGDYEGNKNPYAPEYTFNLGAQYRHYSGFYVRADLIGYGEMYFDKANEYSRDAYEIVNAKIGYETEHVDVYLYGKNLFDKEYDSDGYYGGFYTIYSDPGEVGLQLVYRF